MAPIYDYRAIDRSGKNQKGLIESDSARSARQKLKKRGLVVTDIAERSVAKPSRSRQVPFVGGRVGIKQIALMTRQLASLVKANIPLVEALSALVEQTENEKLKIVLDQVRQEVNEGSSLAKAMEPHSKIFDHIFVNMVEAGESSGTLSLVLLKLADLKEAQMRLRSKIISGMTYPALMMVVAVVLIFAIFTFVIPKLTKIFDSLNKPVPVTTKILIHISDLVLNYWYLLIAIGFFGFIFFLRYIRSPKGRPRWDAFRLHVPLFGDIARMVAVTRFASTMSTLLGSGVPILTSMNITKNLMGNVLIARAIENARENITEGQSIAEPLKRSGEFPPLVIHMIAIGEKTGELSGMLTTVAQTYEDQVNAKIEGLTALMEPLMIILMGGFVTFIVLSIFVPLLEISNFN